MKNPDLDALTESIHDALDNAWFAIGGTISLQTDAHHALSDACAELIRESYRLRTEVHTLQADKDVALKAVVSLSTTCGKSCNTDKKN